MDFDDQPISDEENQSCSHKNDEMQNSEEIDIKGLIRGGQS